MSATKVSRNVNDAETLVDRSAKHEGEGQSESYGLESSPNGVNAFTHSIPNVRTQSNLRKVLSKSACTFAD